MDWVLKKGPRKSYTNSKKTIFWRGQTDLRVSFFMTQSKWEIASGSALSFERMCFVNIGEVMALAMVGNRGCF